MNGVQVSKMGKSGMTKHGAMKNFPGGFPGGNPKSMEAAMKQLQMQGGGGPGAQQDLLKMLQQMSQR